jgi:hypothetical protein
LGPAKIQNVLGRTSCKVTGEVAPEGCVNTEAFVVLLATEESEFDLDVERAAASQTVRYL